MDFGLQFKMISRNWGIPAKPVSMTLYNNQNSFRQDTNHLIM